MVLSKKQIISLAVVLILALALPIVVFLSKKRQDIRPRAALQGKANFLLNPKTFDNITVGKTFDVLVSMQLTDEKLRISGVDFVLLYDKKKLDVKDILPALNKYDPKYVFTDVQVVTSGDSFDNNYNYLRVAENIKKPTSELPGGTFTLAKVTFMGRATGSANIRFPDDNKYLQVVGTGTQITPSP